jgi:uncharacterized damage-inducible protein DinB
MSKVANPFRDAARKSFKDEIARYASAPQKLELALEKLTESKLKWKPNPKKWSIREIVCHLADSDLIGASRMNLIIASSDVPPQLVAYDQDRLAEQIGYNAQNELLAVSAFKSIRKHQSALLKSLPDEQFEKFGIHQERGKMTLGEIIAHYANHAESHLRQIERLKEDLAHYEK